MGQRVKKEEKNEKKCSKGKEKRSRVYKYEMLDGVVYIKGSEGVGDKWGLVGLVDMKGLGGLVDIKGLKGVVGRKGLEGALDEKVLKGVVDMKGLKELVHGKVGGRVDEKDL